MSARRKNDHCSYCGAPFVADQAWPRACAGCANVSYLNPSPVSVLLLPVDEGLLCVRRDIEPGRGQLALPGGFMEVDETWQEAAVRELEEEAGIVIGAGGRMIIAGDHQDGPRQVNMQLWNWRGFDVINAHEREPAVSVQGMREAVAAIEAGLIDPKPLITDRYPLARLGDALNATRDRPGKFVKAVVLTT